MASLYEISSTDPTSTGRKVVEPLRYIPWTLPIKNGKMITIDVIRTEEDVSVVRNLMNDIIEDGMSWPFEEPLSEVEFRNYFLSHAALVARNPDGKIMGGFYCKPNFPGRCSHFCNGGFIVDPEYRGQGIAKCMAQVFLRVAKDLGFKAVFFNLVFTSNIASLKIWDKLGFQRLARLPKVGRLREGFFDAVQFYYDLEKDRQDRSVNPVRSTFKAVRAVSCVVVCGFLFWAGRLSKARHR